MSIATNVAERIPPTVPEIVLDGESLGIIFGPPTNFPQMYCNTSLDCTVAIIKITNKMLFSGEKLSKLRNNSAGTCEIQKIQLIAIHCVLAIRAKNCSVLPLKLPTIGNNKKP